MDNVFAKYLVPGDIVYLAVGDRIPADVRLVRVNELAVDESSFTGETEPKYKSTELRPEAAAKAGREGGFRKCFADRIQGGAGGRVPGLG